MKKLIAALALLMCIGIQNAYAKTYLETIYENYYQILDEAKKSQGDRFITRGEFISVLVGKPDKEYICTFYDVKESQWDYKYIASAQYKKLTLGDGDNAFNSTQYLKVQEAIVFLSRLYKLDENLLGDYSVDEAIKVSEYARKCVGYAINEGLYPKNNNEYLKANERISVKDALGLMESYKSMSEFGFNTVRFVNGYPKVKNSGSSKAITVTLKTEQPCVIYYSMVENESNGFNYSVPADRVDTFLTSVSSANKEITVNLQAEPKKSYDIFFVTESMDGKKSGVYSLKNISVIPFTLGNGTKENPYQIYSEYQLEQIRKYPDKCFLLCVDIDYNKDWIPIGSIRNENDFSGIFDGGGHYIRGLKIDVLDDAGFFARLNNATVKNLYIEADVRGKNNVGVIAGISNKSSITDCHISGTVKASENVAGGIAGKNSGNIINCVSAVYSVESNSYAGGISGTNLGTIDNCISAVNKVSSGMYASAISGINSGGIVRNCVAACAELNNNLSIITGRITTNKENGKTFNNYAYSDMLSEESINVGKDMQDGEEVSWKELTKKQFYEDRLGWNFENKWTMKNAPEFMLPTLKKVHKPMLISGMTIYAPLKISNERELVDISKGLDKHYYLANNIDLEYKNSKEKYWSPLGISDEYGNLYNSFTGTLDGRGYTIKNLMLSHIDNVMQYGLFGVIYGGKVRNLNVENVSGNVRGTVGAIAGVNYGVIENCSAKGKLDVYDRNGESVIGGICGINYTNIISTDSYLTVKADTESASIGGISGTNEGFIYDCLHDGELKTIQGGKSSNVVVGGISGSNYSGFIYNCYAKNNINSDSNTGYCGGIAGLMNEGEIYKCSSNGRIYFESQRKNNSNSYLGGVCGVTSGGLVMNSFSKSDITAYSNEGYVGGISGFSENASVQNVYTMNKITQNGNSDIVYAGGILGYSQDSYVSGSVAVNYQIATNGEYGEILAHINGGNADNNYFYDKMVLLGKKGEQSVDGIKKNYQELKDIDFFIKPVYEGGLLGWEFSENGDSVWRKSENKSFSFPVLENVKNQEDFYYILNK